MWAASLCFAFNSGIYLDFFRFLAPRVRPAFAAPCAFSCPLKKNHKTNNNTRAAKRITSCQRLRSGSRRGLLCRVGTCRAGSITPRGSCSHALVVSFIGLEALPAAGWVVSKV